MFPPNKFQSNVDPDTSIVFFGELFDVKSRIVKWYEKGGYDGYAKNKRVIKEEDRKTGKEKVVKVIKGKRYGGGRLRPGRKAKAIKQFIVHHTGGFLPGVCFNTLHNERRLSVQFIQADNGIIYQALDAKEIAWHAGGQNRCSIGVESCLYPQAWSKPDAYREARCRRLGLTRHEIGECYTQGKERTVFMMPRKQVETLAALIAGTWFARNVICGYDDAPPYFPNSDTGHPDCNFAPEHKKHEGLVLHANVSPRKWDAAGLDALELEQMVGSLYNKMALPRFTKG